MNTWIVLLRGINVGGRNQLPMKALVALLESVGCSDVSTYIQSGNVLLESQETNRAVLCDRIAAAIAEQFGFAPRVQAMTVSELRSIAAANPFPDAVSEPKSLHVSFLSGTPEADLDAMRAIAAPSEAFVLTESAFYLHAPQGVGRSRLAANVETLLGVEATARNWRTVTKLVEMAESRSGPVQE